MISSVQLQFNHITQYNHELPIDVGDEAETIVCFGPDGRRSVIWGYNILKSQPNRPGSLFIRNMRCPFSIWCET